MAAATTMPRLSPSKMSSFGFSGAGFLAAYHMGVSKCLIDQGILPKQGFRSTDADRLVALTGVSAGAIVATATMAGVDPEEGLEAVIQVSRQTRDAGGYLDTLSPSTSLVDTAEKHVGRLVRQAVYDDEEYFLERIKGRLRIGLTDRRVFPPLGQNPLAACYCDTFTSLEDVLACCTLSSYVPAITGPAFGSLNGPFGSVGRAGTRLRDMIAAGHVKYAATGEPIPAHDLDSSKQAREICWDGGLVDAFPYIDQDTVIVSPLAISVSENATINPSVEYDHSSIRLVRVNDRIQLHWTSANAHTLRHITFSSDDEVLHAKFAQGFDNTYSWLQRHSLVSVHRHSSAAVVASADLDPEAKKQEQEPML